MGDWWAGATIYQIYPRSFCDSNGDGVGDLAGITEKLPYIAKLGVNAIWISPFFKSPMRDFGYDVEDYYDVDSTFGDLQSFDRLVGRAHEFGLKVIIDQVYSHSSDQCEWFKESRSDKNNPKSDWYVWAEANADGSPPNNWESEFGGSAWTWDENRQQYYLHNFFAEQPDLNLHCDAVRNELQNVMRFWLAHGVDGFRFDAVNHYLHDPELRDDPGHSDSHPSTGSCLEQLRETMNEYSDRFSVAEVGGDHSFRDMVDYTLGNKRLNTAYSFAYLELDSITPQQIRQVQTRWEEGSDSWPSLTFGNHDSPRFSTRLADGLERQQFAHLIHAILLSLRGIVFLYQGDELGLPQSDVAHSKLQDPEGIRNWPNGLGRDGARTPMPWSGAEQNGGWVEGSWLPVEPSHFSMSVAAQAANPNSVLSRWRQLIAVRKLHPALVQGDVTFLDCPDEILAFERGYEDEKLLCVFNMSGQEFAWTLPGSDEAEMVYELVDGSSTGAQLPPLGGYIVRLKAG